MKPFAKDLINYRKRVYSQTIEDGIIEGIFDNIGTTNKYFIEFGAWDGIHFSNTANLRINKGWKGLLLEGNEERANKYDYVEHAFITAENINTLFEKHDVPKEYDLLSIDLDGNDYWIWKSIDEGKFKARVVVVEYNSNFPNQYESKAIKYDANLISTNPSIHYYGATIPAFKGLGELKGYSLIYRVNNHNLFFVRTDLLHEKDTNIELEYFLNKDGKAEKGIQVEVPDQSKNVFGYDTKLLHDVFPQSNKYPSDSPYADTTITIFWDQDFSKEWIEV
tara:strand:- start:6640 stop:7473 length:834 start_codon:yes stop_codon:yes gene_type:complete